MDVDDGPPIGCPRTRSDVLDPFGGMRAVRVLRDLARRRQTAEPGQARADPHHRAPRHHTEALPGSQGARNGPVGHRDSSASVQTIGVSHADAGARPRRSTLKNRARSVRAEGARLHGCHRPEQPPHVDQDGVDHGVHGALATIE